MNSLSPGTRSLVIFVARAAIAAAAIFAWFMLVIVSTISAGFSRPASISHNEAYVSMYVGILLISAGVVLIFKTSRISRIITFVMLFTLALSLMAVPGIMTCLQRVESRSAEDAVMAQYGATAEISETKGTILADDSPILNGSEKFQCYRTHLFPTMGDHTYGLFGLH